MRIYDDPQGTVEWKQNRAGVITASMFHLCRQRYEKGPKRGQFTDEGLKYAFRLAVERISGDLLDDTKYRTRYMDRGNTLEEDARLLHEEREGILVEQVGFITTDNRRFGASPDGLIEPGGGSEYKAFIAPDSLMPIILDDDIGYNADQVQGGMMITDREWWHFVLYCPALANIGLDLKIMPVERDEKYIKSLYRDLLLFDELVEETRHKIEAKAPQQEEDLFGLAPEEPQEDENSLTENLF